MPLIPESALVKINQLEARIAELEHDHNNDRQIIEGLVAGKDRLKARVAELETVRDELSQIGVDLRARVQELDKGWTSASRTILRMQEQMESAMATLRLQMERAERTEYERDALISSNSAMESFIRGASIIGGEQIERIKALEDQLKAVMHDCSCSMSPDVEQDALAVLNPPKPAPPRSNDGMD